MTNNIGITTILFDVGRTIRISVRNQDKQIYWANKILALTGLDWTSEELMQNLTDRSLAYKKWGEENLDELEENELWKLWLLPEFSDQLTPSISRLLTRYSRKAIGDGVLLPNASEVIQELFSRGYRLGIVSNTISSEQTPDFIKNKGLAKYFETVVLSCTFGKRKPHPSIFHAATDWMNVNPANCAYVGDQIDRDIFGSKNAGFGLAILIDHFNSKPVVQSDQKIKPDYTIKDLRELLTIFRPFYLSGKNGKNFSKPINKPVWNVAISTMWSYENKLGIDELIGNLPQMELAGIELNHSISTQDLHKLDLRGAPIWSIHEPCPADVSMSELRKKDWLISSVNEEYRKQGVRMAMRSIDLAHNLGAQQIVVHPGEIVTPNHLEKKLRQLFDIGKKGMREYQVVMDQMISERSENIDKHLSAVEKSLQDLLHYSCKTGIKISLENRYHYMDIPSPEEMSRLLALADDSRIGMQYDIGHAVTLDALGFYPWMEWLERFGNRLFGLHLHDVQGVIDHFAPGLGDIDYSKVAQFVPESAQRILEVRGENSLAKIQQGLKILSESKLVRRI